MTIMKDVRSTRADRPLSVNTVEFAGLLMKMSRMRFYLSAQNLLTIQSRDFTGVDPENPNYGYPIPINLTFGLNIGF